MSNSNFSVLFRNTCTSKSIHSLAGLCAENLYKNKIITDSQLILSEEFLFLP